MPIVVKYRFNPKTYANLLPQFNSGYTSYTVSDVTNHDGTITRTIESSTLPTLMRFGTTAQTVTDTKRYDALLEIYEINCSNLTDMNAMFRKCSNLKYLDLSNQDLSKVTNMPYVFSECYSLSYVDLSNTNTINNGSLHSIFMGCSKLKSVKLKNFRTDKVTVMTNMFNGCSSLTSLDVSSFNTENVTSMSSMFQNCELLTSLDLSSFDTKNVTSLASMFYNCRSLTSLDLLHFNTSKVTVMSGTFIHCKSLKTLKISNWDTSKVTNFSHMFQECMALEELNIARWDTSSATDMEYMFMGCSSLTSLDISRWDVSKVENMNNIFNGMYKITTLDLTRWNTESLTNMDLAFANCRMETLDLENWNVSKVTRFDQTFAKNHNLTELKISSWNTSSATVLHNMFDSCQKLEKLDVSKWDVSKVANFSGMFVYCQSLVKLDLTNWNTESATSMSYMFSNCSKLKEIKVSNFTTNLVTDMKFMFNGCTSLTSLNLTSFNTDRVTYSENMLYGLPKTATVYLNQNTTSTLDTSSYSCNIIKLNGQMVANYKFNSTIDSNLLPNFNGDFTDYVITDFNNTDGTTRRIISANTLPTSATFYVDGVDNKSLLEVYNLNGNFTSCASMFSKCQEVTKISIDFTLKNVTSMYDMFYNCNKLETVDVSAFDVSNVKRMNSCFNLCLKLRELDVAHWDVSSVTNISSMFQHCQTITSLDVSRWNIENVTTMSGIFQGCSALVNLDVSNWNVGKVGHAAFLFAGTKLTSMNLNKWNVENIVYAESMFANCTELETLYISSWNTNSVKFLNSMFAGCSKLTKIDVSNFNTTQVENFAHMFNNCTSLKLLDLTSFDTRKAFVAENIEGMFNNCTSDLRVFTNSNTWTIAMAGYSVNHNSVDGRLVAITLHDTSVYDNYIPTCEDGTQLAMHANIVVDNTKQIRIFTAPTLPTSIMFGQKWVDEQTDTDTHARTNSLLEVNFVNVNNLTTMEAMFRRNFNLTKIDFYGTTKNVTNMYGTFASIDSLNYIDLSNFNTKLVTNMSNMFSYCKGLKQLDVSHFDTQNVKDMSVMFNYCEYIKELDLSQWNTENVTDIQRMFMDCRQLQSIDLSNFNMEKVTSIISLFHNDHALQSVKFPIVRSSALTHASSVVANCESLDEVDLTPLNTSSLVYTITMFNNCTKIKTINMDGMDVSKVINFNQMFSGCNSLTGLRISGWKTDSATSMENVFNGCHSIEYLDVANWNVSKVTNMSNLFRECKNLKQIDVSKWQTDSVTDISYMFDTCENLESINVSNFNVSKVNTMACMFTKCRKLKKLDLSTWNTNKVIYMNHLFSYCSSLESVDVSGFDTSLLSYTPSMFTNCTSLKVIDLTSFQTSTITSCTDMFTGLTSDQVVYVNANTWTLDTSTYDVNVVPVAGRLIANYKFNSKKYNDYLPKFNDDFANAYSVYDNEIPDVITVDSSKWNLGVLNTETGAEVASSTNFLSDYIEIVNDVYYLFSVSVGLCFYTDNKTFISGNQGTDQVRAPENAKYVRVFRGTRPTTFTLTTSGVITRAISSNYTPNSITFGHTYLEGETNEPKTLSLMEVYSTKLDGLSTFYAMFSRCKNLRKVNINFGQAKNIVATNSMFDSCNNLQSLDLSNMDTHSLTNISYMFSACYKLTGIGDLSKWDVSNVAHMESTFMNCESITSFDFVKDWDVRNVQSMSNMFNNCFGITSLDLSNWNPKSVTQLNGMFNNARDLITLDVSGWNTYKVTTLEQTFSNLTKLTSLNIDGWNTRNVTNLNLLFSNCRALPNIDISNIQTDSVTIMNDVFQECFELTELDLSHWDTSNCTSFYGVFSKCKKLQKVNLVGWDTSKCTDLSYMFNFCSSLKELDLSHFNVTKVRNMYWMFCECTSLEKLNVSTWSTNSLTDCRNMFERCTSLTELDLSSFNVNNVTSFGAMFNSCSNLEVLDISNFHFGGVNQNVPSDFFINCNKLKHIGMIYCRASSFNSLQGAFNNLKATPVNVYYHDASLSDLTAHVKVTYVYYDKSTVTLPYELNKLPNGVADYIDVVNGVYVQRVGKFIANGTESWVINTFANASINDQCTIFTHNIKDKKDNYNHTKLCDKWTLNTTEITTIANIEGIHVGGNSDSFFINVSNSKATTVEQWKAYLQSNPFTYMYELATPIYTPLTDGEKASLPLSTYSSGYIQLSSDELRPSKFEFRAKSSNRLQLDMLEKGHYYLDAPTGNVKLGNVDIDVTEMPCLIKVDNESNKRLICGATEEKQVPITYGAWVDKVTGQLSGIDTSQAERDAYSEYISITSESSVTISHYSSRASGAAGIVIAQFNTNRQLVKVEKINHIPNTTYEAKSIITDNTRYIRFSVPMSKSEYDAGYKTVSVTFGDKITLSKLPSHRIPTTFTQGMKSSVNFGYWQGSKEAKGTSFRTNKVSDGSNVDSCNIYNGTGIVLNRVVLDGKVIEDELDISTGKYIKRIEKVTVNGSENWTQNTGGTAFVNANSHYTTLSKRSSGYDCCSDKLKFRAYWSADEPRVWIDGRQRLVVHLPFGVSYNTTVLKQYLSENPITVYYQLETPEISYIDLPKNVLKTAQDATYSILWTTTGYLVPQVKPAPLSYPTTLSPNTQYTVFHNRKNYGGSVKTPMINLGGTEVAATGSRTVVTTPSTLAHNELQFIGAENTVEQVMILHGDWTKEGKTVDYFEGLQSSVIGDKTLENLVDKPVEIWSNKVTSDGGAVDYVSIDDVIAVGYGNRAKLPEVQVDTNVRNYGMTLQNLVESTSVSTTDIHYNLTLPHNAKQNTTYTFICDVDFEYGDGYVDIKDNSGIYCGFLNSSGGDWNHTTGTFFSGKQYKGKVVIKITTTANSIGNKFRVRFYQQTVMTKWSATNFMILEGDYTNMDIPFFEGMKSVENPVLTSIGKNLFDGELELGSIVARTGEPEPSDVCLRSVNFIKVRPSTPYAITNDLGYTIAVYEYDSDFNFIKNTSYNKTYTTLENTAYIKIKTSASKVETDLSVKFQLEEGTQATEYEPYKSSILSTPQGTVLRGVGSYKDMMGWNDGTIRRKCVEFTITGEEGYTITGITENTNTILCGIAWKHLGLENKIANNDTTNTVICDKLPSMGDNRDAPHIRQSGGQSYSDSLMFWFDKTKFSTYTSQGINDYIKSIGGLTIVAPLANTEYEDVEIIGGGNWERINLAECDISKIKYSEYQPNNNTLARFDIINVLLGIVPGQNDVGLTDSKLIPYYYIHQEANNYASGINIECISNHTDSTSHMHLIIKRERLTTQDVNGLKQYLQENPITVWYQSTSKIITNTDPLIFNHGTLYTTTDTHPSTFSDFSLKTTNRYTVKDFDKLKYTVLTEQPFYLNGVDYPASPTGMTIIDVTGIADTSIYSDDTMITVIQEDGNYYADGVLTQFKGTKTFTKEFIRTSNGTYDTGMTLLEPLELCEAYSGETYDIYNPITGILHKNARAITITSDEIKNANITISTTNNNLGGYSFTFTYFVGVDNVCINRDVDYKNTTYGANRLAIGSYSEGKLHLYFHYDSSYGAMTVDDFKNLVNEDLVFTYQLKTPQIIQATPTSTYISTRPENGNIIAQDTQIQAEYLNYDNEQSIISPRMLGDGDTIRWEQGSQCYVYENDNEYIPLTDHDELFGANLQAQEYTQYAESVDGTNIELGVALKEKAVYEQTYVKYEDNVVYPETMENIDETNGVEVDYICGATWQNSNDLSDIRHLGELREDGQYDVTIRRSGDDEIRLLEGTTHISLDYDELPSSEFELTFFNNGGVEVGKYGDTTHVLEDCVENSKLASSTVYGQTLVNCLKPQSGSYTDYQISSTYDFTLFKPNTLYTFINNWDKGGTLAISGNNGLVINVNFAKNSSTLFTTPSAITNIEIYSVNSIHGGTSSDCEKWKTAFIVIEGDYTNVDIPYFEGMKSTVVNGFSSCGKNLIYGSTTGTMEDNGLTWTWDNGVITLNGQKTNNDSYLYLRDGRLNIHPMIDGYYSISYKVLSGEVDTTECRSGNHYGQFTLSDYTNTYGLQLHGDKSSYYYDNIFFYGILPSKLAGCWMRVHQGTKFNNLKIQFQLERNSVHTAFEEPKIINYSLPTPITLRKVGDVCDTFDVVSGVETRNVTELTFNGSEDWDAIFNSSSSVFKLALPTIKANSQLLIKNGLVDGITSIAFENNALVVKTTTNFASISVNNFKNKLKDNPITIYAQLTNPQTIQHTLIPSTTQTTQEPTFILPQPLRSVPNGICDRLYWDENKGHYCIEKRVERFVVDGSDDEQWWLHRNSSSGYPYYYGLHSLLKIQNTGNNSLSSIYLENFKSLNGISSIDNSSSTNEGAAFEWGELYLRFNAKKYPSIVDLASFKTYFNTHPMNLYYPLATSEIIDLPHLDKKVELPTQPDIYPIGYKAAHEKVNPEIGLTIPYKVLNMPTQPVNLNFVMDIADYVLTWDDVKEARQYNIILNDEVIATVKEPQYNTGEEMYGYILVEANNEIGDNLSEELYIKTVPNAPAQLTVAHNPLTDHYDFEISFIDTSDIADYYTVMYKVDGGEWVIHTIQNSELTTGEKHLWNFSVYEIKESIEVWATATNDVGTNDILPTAIYYMSPTPQWTYRINSKDVFLRWLDESPYDTKYKLRYSYKSNGQFQYAYFEGDTAEIGKLYEAVLPLAEDDEVTLALCIVSEKENLYCKPIKASKPLDPNIVPPMNFNYHWLARGLIEFYWEDQYDVDVEYEYILESMKANEVLWTQVNKIIPSEDVEGTGTVYRVEYQLEDLEQIRMKVRMKWAMNDTEWTETLTTVFIPVEGNPPTYIRRTQTAEGLLIEWEAQAYIDSYHIYVIDNETGEELQHLETLDNSILVDLDYSNSIEIAIYEISRFSGGIESDPTDPMVFTPTMFATDIDQRIYRPCAEEYPIETSTVQKATKQPYVIHDISYTPNVETEHEVGVAISSPFQISYHPMMVDVHQAGSRDEHTINAHIKTLDVRNEDLIRVMTFERTQETYDMNFTVYTPSVASYPINLEVSKVRIVCLGDSLTSGHPFYWD